MSSRRGAEPTQRPPMPTRGAELLKRSITRPAPSCRRAPRVAEADQDAAYARCPRRQQVHPAVADHRGAGLADAETFQDRSQMSAVGLAEGQGVAAEDHLDERTSPASRPASRPAPAACWCRWRGGGRRQPGKGLVHPWIDSARLARPGCVDLEEPVEQPIEERRRTYRPRPPAPGEPTPGHRRRPSGATRPDPARPPISARTARRLEVGCGLD